MTKPNVVAPVININGTSERELLNQLQNASRAILEAYHALQEAAPHGRDYQTAPVGTYGQAREQHSIWLGQLDDIRQALGEIANQIYAQKL
jgi:predicted AlkP superfamily pyrophosphatase or phosphodiesterase